MKNPTNPGVYQQAALTLFLLSGTVAVAQQVLAPAMPNAVNNRTTSPAASLLTFGRFEIHPGFSYQLTYADGLQQTPGLASDTRIQTYLPSILVQAGQTTSLSYVYNRSLYSNDLFSDTEGHNASLATSKILGETNINGSFDYLKSTEVLVETSRQTTLESYTTRLGFGRSFGRHTAFSIDLSHSDRNAAGVLAPTPELSNPGWEDWTAAVRGTYQFSMPAQVALSVARTMSYVSTGPDIISTRPQIELAWQPTPKISTKLAVGMDFQEYSTGDVGQRSDPAYTLTGEYKVTSTTNLSVAAERSTSASHFANQSTLAETLRVGINQRLLQRLFFNASYSDQKSSYRDTFFVGAAPRKNHVETYSAGLGTSFLQRGSLSVSYSDSRNNSSLGIFSYQTRQVSLEVGYRY